MKPSPVFIIDGNSEKEGIAEILSELLHWSTTRGRAVALAASLSRFVKSADLDRAKNISVFSAQLELEDVVHRKGRGDGLIICLGGDGSVLYAVGKYRDFNFPVMGVNLGSLGFNASVSPKILIKTLEAWEEDKTQQVEHMLFTATLIRRGSPTGDFLAVNDAVLHRHPNARILDMELRQGQSLVLACHADGLILATPTGSTAYNLSAGGPILHPSLSAFVATTLGAHSLSNRSIALGTDPPLRLSWRVRRGAPQPVIAIDGQMRWSLGEGDEIEIAKAPRTLKVVNPAGLDYFQTLREKLHWSLPIRPHIPDLDED